MHRQQRGLPVYRAGDEPMAGQSRSGLTLQACTSTESKATPMGAAVERMTVASVAPLVTSCCSYVGMRSFFSFLCGGLQMPWPVRWVAPCDRPSFDRKRAHRSARRTLDRQRTRRQKELVQAIG